MQIWQINIMSQYMLKEMRKYITYSFFFINLDGQQIYNTVTIATIRPHAGQDCNKLITDFLSLTVQRYNISEKISLKHSVHFVCKSKDHGDRREVNPESWTQLKGSNEKGI